MEIKFTDIASVKSQMTLVKIFKKYEYYFATVNEYDNHFFTCIIKVPYYEPCTYFLKFFGFKRKVKYYEYPLRLACGSDDKIFEPLVFNREEVQKIINDAPENYVGNDTL